MNFFKLNVGDPSNDGHGRSESYLIKCELTLSKIRQYYRQGVSIVGFDLSEKVARDYEDGRIWKKHLDLLIAQGFDPETLDDYTKGEEGEFKKYNGSACLDGERFVEIYMFIASLGYKEDTDKELNWDFHYSNIDSHDIGGYGLFS